MKKCFTTLLLLLLSLLLCSCRVRTTLLEPEPEPAPPAASEPAPVRIDAVLPPEEAEEPSPEEAEELPPQEPEELPIAPPPELPPEEPEQPPVPEEPQEAVSPDAPAQQDEDSRRREFSPDASGEIAPDAETPLYAAAEEPEEPAAPAADGTGEALNVEAEGAELTAAETVPDPEAEEPGVDESGETAESVLTYYQTLLDDRLGSLFECKRLYVYWETAEDHRTVHKSSPEHQMILSAGAYDVSAKLLEENLTVDDGWVSRKNPDAVVKIADGGALDPGEAAALCEELSQRPEWAGVTAVRERRVLILSGQLLDTPAGRTAAALFLAKLLYPEQLSDVDADEALRAMTEEAGGSAYIGLYSYPM